MQSNLTGVNHVVDTGQFNTGIKSIQKHLRLFYFASNKLNINGM